MANLRSLTNEALINLARTAHNEEADNLMGEIENEVIRRDDRALDAAFMNVEIAPAENPSAARVQFRKRMEQTPFARGGSLWDEEGARP